MLSDNYMLSEKLKKSLNDQMLMEYCSSLLYLAASHYFTIRNFKGLAHWFDLQSQEEYSHFKRFLNLFKRLRANPTFEGIPLVSNDWTNVKSVIDQAVKHEQNISTAIHDLYSVSYADKNILVCDFFKWFIDEQLEEENSILDVQDLYKKYEDGKTDLIDFDRSLLERKKEYEHVKEERS